MFESTGFTVEQYLHTDLLFEEGIPDAFQGSAAPEPASDKVEPDTRPSDDLANNTEGSIKATTKDYADEERLFRCPGDGCTRVFKKEGSLRLHAHYCLPTPDGSTKCKEEGCARSFKNKGDLNRHMREKHRAPTDSTAHLSLREMLCPKDMCERGVPGQGFSCRYRLVDHLMSANNNRFPGQGHGMTKSVAQRLVAETIAQTLIAGNIERVVEDQDLDEARKAELIVMIQAGGRLCAQGRDIHVRKQPS